MRVDNEKVSGPSKFVLWACGVLITACLSLLSYTALLLHSIDVQISVHATEFRDAERRLGGVEQELQENVPARWLREFVGENRKRIQELERR